MPVPSRTKVKSQRGPEVAAMSHTKVERMVPVHDPEVAPASLDEVAHIDLHEVVPGNRDEVAPTGQQEVALANLDVVDQGAPESLIVIVQEDHDPEVAQDLAKVTLDHVEAGQVPTEVALVLAKAVQDHAEAVLDLVEVAQDRAEAALAQGNQAVEVDQGKFLHESFLSIVLLTCEFFSRSRSRSKSGSRSRSRSRGSR